MLGDSFLRHLNLGCDYPFNGAYSRYSAVQKFKDTHNLSYNIIKFGLNYTETIALRIMSREESTPQDWNVKKLLSD